MHHGRRRLVIVFLAVATGLGGSVLATGAAAGEEGTTGVPSPAEVRSHTSATVVDITPRPGSRDVSVDLAVTDGAVHVMSFGFEDGVYRPSVWRRTVALDGAGDLVLDGARRVGRPLARGGGGLASSGPAAVWTDEAGGNLVILADDGTTTLDASRRHPAVASVAAPWYTSDDSVMRLDGDGDPQLVTTAVPADDLAPWGDLPTVVESNQARTNGELVAWATTMFVTEPSSGLFAVRVYAAPLGDGGIEGAPALLDAVHEPTTEDLVPGPMDLSGDVLVWAVTNETSSVLRWVRTGDLGAPPQEVSVAGRVNDLGTDGTTIAWTQGREGGLVAALRVDDPDGTLWTTPAVLPSAVAVRGEVVTWVEVPDGDQNRVRVASSSGRQVLLRPTFPDVRPVDPLLPSITWLGVRGVTTGYPDGSFRPEEPVRRHAMAAFLARLSGEPVPTPADPPFADVGIRDPFYSDISWLADRGISTGTLLPGGAALFRPAAPVSRQAMAAFLHRYAGSPATSPPTTSPFADVAPSDAFYEEIAWLAATGIATGTDVGDGTVLYRPTAPVSRRAMAAFLHRFDTLVTTR